MRALNFLFFLFLFSLITNGAAPNTNAPPADVNATDQNSSDNLTDAASASEIEEGEKDEKKSWIGKFLESGPIGLLIKGGWFMVPILLLAILALGVIIERWRSLKMLGTDNESLRQAVLDDLTNDRVEEALALCER